MPEPYRGEARGIAFHNDINRAKRSLLLDLKSEAGREIFWQLPNDYRTMVEGRRTRVRVCTACIKSNKVVKA